MMVGMDKNFRRRRDFVGDAPEKRMDAERNKLPAGVPLSLTNGWLFQDRRNPHEMQLCLTVSKEPCCLIPTVHVDEHFMQTTKSCIRAE